eukprot:scaffold14.g1199.t1
MWSDRTGAVDDIRRATDLARKAVSEYGLSASVGPLSVALLEAGGDEYAAVLKDGSSGVARRVCAWRCVCVCMAWCVSVCGVAWCGVACCDVVEGAKGSSGVARGAGGGGLVEREVRLLCEGALAVAREVVASNARVHEGMSTQLQAEERLDGPALQAWLEQAVVPDALKAFVLRGEVPRAAAARVDGGGAAARRAPLRASAANVVGPEWYKCDPLTCQAPDCMCPSDSAPGGLTPAETPQFVLVQHSMALEEQAYGIMESVRKGLNNPNGCPIPMTWFAMMYHSNCSTGWAAQGRGDEIAMQTNRYTPVYPFNLKARRCPRAAAAAAPRPSLRARSPRRLPPAAPPSAPAGRLTRPPPRAQIDPNPRYNNSGPNGKSSLLKEIEMSRAWWNTACKIPLKGES